MCRPGHAPSRDPFTGGHTGPPLRGRMEGSRNHPAQRRTAKRLRRGWEKRGGIAAEIIPKGASNLGQSLSQPAADSSLCTREPFPAGDEGCGLPRRFAPRNDSPKPLSFRGGPTGRRGNPSFLRWTGVRAAVPRAWPPPTKFRTEIWGVGQVVGPYGKPNQPPKPAAHSEAFAPAGARDG